MSAYSSVPSPAVRPPTVHRMVPGRTLPQLRMLLANDRRRIEELSAAMESMETADLTPDFLRRCQHAETRLKGSQLLLEAYLMSEEHGAGSREQETTPQAASVIS